MKNYNSYPIAHVKPLRGLLAERTLFSIGMNALWAKNQQCISNNEIGKMKSSILNLKNVATIVSSLLRRLKILNIKE
jgi:hypothetical protein